MRPDTTATRPVAGLNLRNPTLGAELGPGRTLLVFLRHLG